MAFYSITYDLNHNKDYEALYKKIKQLSDDAWCRPTLSQWIIHSPFSAKEILDMLKLVVDRDDELFILEVNLDNWQQSNIPRDALGWLRRHS